MTDPDDLLPEGLEDRLPAEAAALTAAMRAALDVLDAHGYDRVRPPLVEFERSLAGRMDGVQPRRMFRFVDPASLRTLALRSDMTPQIGRIAATGLAGAPRQTLFLPVGHNVEVAARLRAIGWRTVAALSEGENPRALGCTHRLDADGPVDV